jgi:6-phosphogluconolactonase
MIIRGKRESLEKKAGFLLAQTINRILQEQPTVVLGVPGGRSVASVLRYLGTEPVEWTKVHLFMVDERFVPIDHPDSNFTQVAAAVGPYLKKENIHPFRYDPAIDGSGTEAYREELAGVGGRFDIVLLSSGEDGHIASLFPEHETVMNPDDSFIRTSSAPKPPPARMSASRKLLEGARAALLLFLGSGKEGAFSLFSDREKSVEQCPAKVVQKISIHFILAEWRD